MKITAPDLVGLGIVDEIVPEPAGGAHANHEALFKSLDAMLDRQLSELLAMKADALVEARYAKFRNMGRLGHEFVARA